MGNVTSFKPGNRMHEKQPRVGGKFAKKPTKIAQAAHDTMLAYCQQEGAAEMQAMFSGAPQHASAHYRAHADMVAERAEVPRTTGLGIARHYVPTSEDDIARWDTACTVRLVIWLAACAAAGVAVYGFVWGF